MILFTLDCFNIHFDIHRISHIIFWFIFAYWYLSPFILVHLIFPFLSTLQNFWAFLSCSTSLIKTSFISTLWFTSGSALPAWYSLWMQILSNLRKNVPKSQASGRPHIVSSESFSENNLKLVLSTVVQIAADLHYSNLNKIISVLFLQKMLN